ncbi:carbohydrate ABC transporter membrane protein 1, CUT1 family [Pseudonocardia thermophila]|uniref:Carbohydrate ABC transporter membrane protein 1, CUT1 family n=1 Tax=Pseudonocardia thermophila TaxID=1848 RepID=A0A1M6VX89_PSETH|nr:sugar ABC transporter permease [Pseudonocardia thermophila]SHK86122.1 carbohydrate ABC transporter membrane protein 1, CUT1 family [Pseudonocardia thermophila]
MRGWRGRTATAYLLLAPSLFGVAVFLVLPILVVLWLALHRWDILTPSTFVGLANVVEVARDGRFLHSLVVTAVFVAFTIPAQTVLGLAAALLINRGLRGSAIYQVVLVLPWICAPLALGVVWRWILAPTDGALNTLLGTRIEWLADPALALPSVAAVSVWTQVGYVALFFVAGLRAIPPAVHEAAVLDGAGPWQRFWRITLPLLRPTTFFVLVTGVIASFQTFDAVYALTPKGGPQLSTDVVAGRIYYEAFESRAVGNAAVMALGLFVVLVVVTVVQQRWFARRTTYDLST